MRRRPNTCADCGVQRRSHTALNRATGACCDDFRDAPPRPTKDDEYLEAWSAMTEDRSTYNLGDGCRRVPARGSRD